MAQGDDRSRAADELVSLEPLKLERLGQRLEIRSIFGTPEAGAPGSLVELAQETLRLQSPYRGGPEGYLEVAHGRPLPLHSL